MWHKASRTHVASPVTLNIPFIFLYLSGWVSGMNSEANSSTAHLASPKGVSVSVSVKLS